MEMKNRLVVAKGWGHRRGEAGTQGRVCGYKWVTGGIFVGDGYTKLHLW